MTADDIFVLGLSPMEVEWILHQLHAPDTRLLPSLSEEPTTQELREAFEQAQSSLERRGWIESQTEGQFVLDVTVAGVVGILGFATEALFATQFREQDLHPQVHRYFSAEGLIVEQRGGDSAEEITLTALRDAETLSRRLDEYLGLRSQEAPVEGAFRCDEEAFGDVPYILAGDGRPAAVARLVEIGAEERMAAGLIRAMECPMRQTTLQALQLDPDHESSIRLRSNLTVLEGVSGLWVLHTCLEDEPVSVEILPSDADRVRGVVGATVEFLVL